MSTEFGEKLMTAIEENKNNVNNFIWKGQKVKDEKGNFVQEEVKLIEATPEQLQRFYSHCQTMLYNEDKRYPGRVVLLNDISDQRDRCGIDLFFRDAEAKKTSRFAIVDSMRAAIKKHEISNAELENIKLGDLMTTSSEFQSLPVKLIIDGGLDKLGRFDRSHITLTFILKQGLWFTKQEYKDNAELFENKKSDKMSIIKEKLNLPKEAKLNFNPSGLSFTQLKAMLSLKNKKYSELTTEQLKTLRYKTLFALEDEVHFHIDQWILRRDQIEKIAEVRGISLK